MNASLSLNWQLTLYDILLNFFRDLAIFGTFSLLNSVFNYSRSFAIDSCLISYMSLIHPKLRLSQSSQQIILKKQTKNFTYINTLLKKCWWFHMRETFPISQTKLLESKTPCSQAPADLPTFIPSHSIRQTLRSLCFLKNRHSR